MGVKTEHLFKFFDNCAQKFTVFFSIYGHYTNRIHHAAFIISFERFDVP